MNLFEESRKQQRKTCDRILKTQRNIEIYPCEHNRINIRWDIFLVEKMVSVLI